VAQFFFMFSIQDLIITLIIFQKDFFIKEDFDWLY